MLVLSMQANRGRMWEREDIREFRKFLGQTSGCLHSVNVQCYRMCFAFVLNG